MTAIDTTRENRKLAANQTAVDMPEFTQENIKVYLLEYIKKSEIPIEEVAIMLGVSKSTVYDMLNDKSVGERSLFKVAKGLGLQISIKKPDNQ